MNLTPPQNPGAVIFLGSFTHDAGLSHHTVEPAWWCLMFGIAMTISLVGGKLFWNCNKMLACAAIGVLLIYILGSFAAVNYNEYADGTAAVEGREVVRQVHHTSGMFLGLQYLPLMSGMCKDVSGNTTIAIVFHSSHFVFLIRSPKAMSRRVCSMACAHCSLSH